MEPPPAIVGSDRAPGTTTAGRNLPVKWTVSDPDGAVVGADHFLSLTYHEVDCDTGDPIGDPVAVETRTGLNDRGTGKWSYNWKTPPGLAGACVVATLELIDGPAPDRRFRVDFG